MDNFLKRKQDVLGKKDKSSIGKWDEKIEKLCDKINTSKNYYTTSSCAGRILLIVDQEKKGENLFLKVWHEKVRFEELMKEIGEIISRSQSSRDVKLVNGKLKSEVKGDLKFGAVNINLKRGDKNVNSKIGHNSSNQLNIKFKQEPFILHVACKDIESARKLLNITWKAGIKRAGIISLNEKSIIVEINSTEKLEFPLIAKGKLLVDDAFLKIALKKANENLEKNWEKINRLEKKFLN